MFSKIEHSINLSINEKITGDLRVIVWNKTKSIVDLSVKININDSISNSIKENANS